MKKCPKCNALFESCGACRADERHQQCVDDYTMCHECLMAEKWPNKPVEPTAETQPACKHCGSTGPHGWTCFK